MLIDPATSAAFERISQRAADVNMAFTPGAVPTNGDATKENAPAHVTIDPLSVTAPEQAYFVTSDERGRTCYTRDGSLALRESTITGSNGKPMFGFTSKDGVLVPLRVDAVDAALGRVRNLHVEADGTVAYLREAIDPRSGLRENDRIVVGRLGLARFTAATKLSPVDANHFIAAPEDVPHLGRANDGNFGAVTPFAREASRVDLDESLRRLNDAYIAFAALQAAHKAQGHLGKTAMDLLK